MRKVFITSVFIISIIAVLSGCTINNKVEETIIENNEITNENIDKGKNDEIVNNNKIKDDNKAKDNNSEIDKSKITIESFIPKEEYIINNECSDFVSNENHIKGNGKSYQLIGTNGKGPFIRVYTIIDKGLYEIYSGDLKDEEFLEVDKINYLDKVDSEKKVLLLKEPIQIGTKWDNKEIVEVGKNLKLDNITLKGAYAKTWEKEKDNNGLEVVKVCYYSEGLGCVKYKVIINGLEMEHSKLSSSEVKNK